MSEHKFYFGDWVHAKKFRNGWQKRLSSKMTDAVFLKEVDGYGWVVFENSKTPQKFNMRHIYSGWLNKINDPQTKEG